jgi:hypothetical protein
MRLHISFYIWFGYFFLKELYLFSADSGLRNPHYLYFGMPFGTFRGAGIFEKQVYANGEATITAYYLCQNLADIINGTFEF